MRNERGGIKLITLLELILIVILLLYAIMMFLEFLNENKDENEYISFNDKETTLSVEDFPVAFLRMENNENNTIYSPISIKYALAMLQNGADGDTYSQIDGVIGKVGFTPYKNIENKLSFANAIFFKDTSFQYIKKDYIDNLTNNYGAEVLNDKLKNSEAINKWVAEKTFNIIPNMMQDENIAKDGQEFLLANAMAINMEWEEPFHYSYTKGASFKLADGSEIIATTMALETQSENTKYFLGNKGTAVSMDLKPEEGTELEFIAIEPKADLDEYISSFKLQNINNVLRRLKPASETKNGIKIQIPKFSYDYNLNIIDDLKRIGITNAFDNELADFSKMADIEKLGRKISVTDAIHKTKIDFSEEGVKTASVTDFSVSDSTMSSITKAQIIKIDKPFLYLIRDKNSNEILVMGTVYEPRYWSNDQGEYSEIY